ncbi:DUF2914 domain-containing protein [Ectothiorhodospira mobilis]|uniref:DUF2914 domain-containing protein n=1 Tax=Ectothiorhodospira mobilis TaxID=195064 RepID=UPI001907D3B4|nr:DUF2914 domain-containing protein [Ectothiorhodospira mobilis]
MRQPNPPRSLAPRLVAPAALALLLPLQPAAAHHHGETDHPALRLAQSGDGAASGMPGDAPGGVQTGTGDTGMPQEPAPGAQDPATPDGPAGEAGGMDPAATDGYGDGIGGEAREDKTMEEPPRAGGTGKDDPPATEAGSRNMEEGAEDQGVEPPNGEDTPEDRAQQGVPRETGPGPHGHVARAAFTSGIEHREPVDRLEAVDADAGKVLFFTEIRNHEGGAIVHQWRYQGWDMGEVRFQVDGPRWRVWSSKTLRPQWTGPWTVRVVDQDGRLLETYRIQVTGGD